MSRYSIVKVAASLILAASNWIIASSAEAAISLVGVPTDTVVNCSSIPLPASVTATGDCAGASAPTNGLLLYYSFNTSNALAIADDSGKDSRGR